MTHNKLKIGFLSDLHFDVNNYMLSERGVNYSLGKMIQETITLINDNELDYVFISGDVMNSLKTIDVVKELNTSNADVYYVLGNHDLWSVIPDTRRIFNKFLQDKNCLVNRSLQLRDDLSVIGMFSWYDGSFSTMNRDKEYYESMKTLWADGKYTDWDNTNDNISKEFIKKADTVIKSVLNQKRDQEIILLNHFVPLSEFTLHKHYDDSWNFGNGYMGTDKFKNLIDYYPQIKHVTFGHTHHQFGMKEVNRVNYIGKPFGYVHEWNSTILHDKPDFVSQLKDSFQILEL